MYLFKTPMFLRAPDGGGGTPATPPVTPAPGTPPVAPVPGTPPVTPPAEPGMLSPTDPNGGTPPVNPNAPPADPNAVPPVTPEGLLAGQLKSEDITWGEAEYPTELKGSITDLANSLGLDKTQSATLAASGLDLAKQLSTAHMELGLKTRTEWLAAFKADPEIGGANLAATGRTAQQLIATFGGSTEERAELSKVLTESNLDTNPTFAKFLVRIGAKTLTESPATQPTPGATPAPGTKASTAIDKVAEMQRQT